jgi:UDP:flavonoid glycosyltransferase YjiC (YdhE family)
MRPDVILLDCMMPGAARAARATGAPVVLVMHTLYRYWDAQWSPRSPMGLWLALRAALPTAAARRPDLALLTTMPEIDHVPERTRMPRSLIAQTGPTVGAAASGPSSPDAEAGDPLVLISLSTISYPGQLDLLRRLVEAVAELPVRAVVTTGPSLEPAALRAPPNVTVQQFVAHDEIMPTARLVIGHGGHGTTMRALAHGVPVLVVPMSKYADHHLVADAVVTAGAGATVSKHASTEALSEAIARTLTDPAIRRGAQRISELLVERSGAASAADAIDRVAATRSAHA